MERPTLPPRRPAASETPKTSKAPKTPTRSAGSSVKKRPQPTPSSVRTRPARAGAPTRRVDVREWLGRVRISGFVVIMLGLVVLGTFVLVPTVGTYMDQRQQVQALRSAVELSQSEVAELQTQRDRWSDPAYIRTQARERLGYTFPGEVVYLIDNDLPASATPQESDEVSGDVGQTRTDWMTQLVRSVAASGAAQVAVPTTPEIGVPDPTPAPAG